MWSNIQVPLYIVTFLVVMIPLMMWEARRVSSNHFKKFNESNIQGTLTEVGASSTGQSMTIDYIFKYVFITKEFVRFQEVAAVGDSIIKPPFSKTLIVKKGDKTYKFTFEESPQKE